MTDPYNSDAPHDLEQDEHLAATSEPVHEAPSEEEFAEAAEHTEEHIDEHGEDHTQTIVRKRSPLLPIAAAAGGILLLGAAAWWQFSGTDTVPAEAPMTIASAPAPSAPAPVAPAPVALAETPTTASAALSAPAHAPIAEMVAVPAPAPVVAQVLPEPVAPAPTPVVVAAPQPVAAVSADDVRIAELNARIDTLQKALDAANSQLSQMNNIAAANARPIGAAESEGVILAAPVKALTPAPTHHHTAHKPAHKPVVVAREKQATVSSRWVLRAAMPGQAWISPGPTSTELKQVKLGDTVPGIGKVTGIIRQGDNWVLQGTKGSLR